MLRVASWTTVNAVPVCTESIMINYSDIFSCVGNIGARFSTTFLRYIIFRYETHGPAINW